MATYSGFKGDDVFYGETGDDLAFGRSGNDRLFGRGGDDHLIGDSGTDTLFGGGGADTLAGGFAGNGDRLFGGGGQDSGSIHAYDATAALFFSLAADGGTSVATLAASSGAVMIGIERAFVQGGYGNDTLYGNSKDDQLMGRDGSDRIFGASGNDYLEGGRIGEGDLIDGGSGDDSVRFFSFGTTGAISFDLSTAGPAVVSVGGSATDTLISVEAMKFRSGDAADRLGGGLGKDSLYGESGDDRLYGGDEADFLRGGSGSDQVFGGSGADYLFYALAGDTVFGGSGSDTLRTAGSFNGDLEIEAENGFDGGLLGATLYGVDVFNLTMRGPGNVTFEGGGGEDAVRSGSGSDTLRGGGGGDTLRGLVGSDFLFGEDGDDRLYGSLGKDRLFGGSGDDFLGVVQSDSNTNSIFGGSGVDTMELVGELDGDAEVRARADLGNFLGVKYSGIDALHLRLIGDNNMTIRGGGGQDSIEVSTGNDTLIGLSGDDTLRALEGVNTIFGGSGSDRAYLRLSTGIGDVTFRQSALDGALIFADGNRVGGVEQLELATGSGRDLLFGNADADRFFGGGGDDTIKGLNGDDSLETTNGGTIFGANGKDMVVGRVSSDEVDSDQEVVFSLFGGQGNDNISLFGETGTTQVVSARLNGQSGDDIVRVALEDLQYGSIAGGSGNDLLRLNLRDINGSFAEIFAFGGGGRDRIDLSRIDGGSIFSAHLYGGEGHDALYLRTQDLDTDNADEVILFGDDGDDQLGAGYLHEGSFKARFSVDVSLVGGSGDDGLYGEGADGDDYMRGGSGIDTLFGGTGEDLFVMKAGDLVSGEQIFGGLGDDTLVVAGGASAAALLELSSVEVIMDNTANSGDDRIFGDSQQNDIRGQSGDDRIYGQAGVDTLRGQAGDDSLMDGTGSSTLLGAAGNDRLVGGDGNDRLGGGSGVDALFGGSGEDFLNGGVGGDRAVGGRGNDTFIVDTTSDRVVELSGGGNDVVHSRAADFSLVDGLNGYVERLILDREAGAGRIKASDHHNSLIGNSFDNRLYGVSGDDFLNGRQGADTMDGGSGNDTFLVDTRTDLVQERDDYGVDLVRAQSDFTLPSGTATAFVENLALHGGFGTLNGAGNSLDNSIEGNTSSNRLAGNQGADHLLGGLGGDTLFGGNGGDTMEGEGGADTIFLGKGDTVFGGSGADQFRFSGGMLGVNGSGGPLIGDFDGEDLGKGNGADKLYFATGLEVGTFAYRGGGAFTAGGNSEARFAGNRQVEVDSDADGKADIFFLVEGLTAAGGLTVSDFIWL